VNRRPLGVLLSLASVATLAGACSQASLPPGTPPPEYEMRPVEPWPPASAVPPVEPAAAPPAQPEPVLPPAEGANDAGVPDSPDAAVDAAPSTGAL